MGSTKLKLVLYGIDAADWQVMQPFLDAGALPNLQGLLAGAGRAELESTIPASTAVAWPTAMTGCNAGKHGLFHFMHLRDHRMRPVSSADRRAPAVWEILSAAGFRVGCIGVPMTYPADPINGWMVCGRGGTHHWDERSVWPATVYDEVRPLLRHYPDYNLLRRTDVPGRARQLTDYWRDRTALNPKLLSHLLSNHPVDVLIVGENITDSVQHKLLVSRRMGDVEDMVLWAYQQADALLGVVLPHTDERTSFLVISDHGAQPLRGYFDLSAWLVEARYLRYRVSSASGPVPRALLSAASKAYRKLLRSLWSRRQVRSFAGVASILKFSTLIDWPHTTAFPWLTGGIMLNTEGRSPLAAVSADAAEALAVEIRDRVQQITNPFTGEQDIVAHLREELYHGPAIGLAPDVTVVPQGLALAVNSSPPYGRGQVFWTEEDLRRAGLGHVIVTEGAHRSRGILALYPSPADLPEVADITCVAPTALGLLGVPVPAHMDGQSLVGAERAEGEPVPTRQATASADYTEEEQEEIARRLADLGYL